MNLIDEVANLKMPFTWQPIGTPGHYKIVSGIEEDKTLDELLMVLSGFQEGDATQLGFIMSGEYKSGECYCEQCQKATKVLRRYRDMAQATEEHR